MRQMIGVSVPLVVCIWLSACGHSPNAPTPTGSTSQPTSGDNPVARLSVAIDSLGSGDAIVLLSEVTADASASSGAGTLTVTTDFGDGTKVSGAVARHVYQTAGTFTIASEVKDAQGRTSTTAAQINVKAISGAWFTASSVAAHRRVEVRRLTIAGQDGLTVRGRYAVTGQGDRDFTGTLSAPRTVRIVIDGGATLLGTLPSRLGEDFADWTLEAGGDGVDGQRLQFHPAHGDPSSPPPDAVLRIRFNSFGDTMPIVSLSRITFDASTSRGTGLLYFIEFGDGQSSTDASATHVVDVSAVLTARLTVVDSLGRTDVESQPYLPFQPLGSIGGFFYSQYQGSHALTFEFLQRSGVQYTCRMISRFEGRSDVIAGCQATLSGERSIRIVVPSLGLEFEGSLLMSEQIQQVGEATALNVQGAMELTQRGGTDDGRTWRLFWYPGE